MSLHAETTMDHKGRSNYKHTYRTGRRGNIWFEVYVCPVCGFTKRSASNPIKGRKIVFKCQGIPPKAPANTELG